MAKGKHISKNTFHIDSMRKLTNTIFAVGALIGILFGGSYHAGKNFFGILLGALVWGVVSAFGLKGLFEFVIRVICNIPENDAPQPEEPFKE